MIRRSIPFHAESALGYTRAKGLSRCSGIGGSFVAVLQRQEGVARRAEERPQDRADKLSYRNLTEGGRVKSRRATTPLTGENPMPFRQAEMAFIAAFKKNRPFAREGEVGIGAMRCFYFL